MPLIEPEQMSKMLVPRGSDDDRFAALDWCRFLNPTMEETNDSPLAPKVETMKKILRVFPLAFVLALLPVAFHGDDQAPLWGVGVGIQDGCAQARGGWNCGRYSRRPCPCYDGPGRPPKASCAERWF